MQRILSLIYLLPVAFVTAVAFGAYVDVEDTISLHWVAGAFDRWLFWAASSGIGLLFFGLVCRFFASRPVLGLTLSTCVGFTLHSLATYPANVNDAHAAPVLSRSHAELYALLAVTGLLLAITLGEPRIRAFIAKKRASKTH